MRFAPRQRLRWAIGAITVIVGVVAGVWYVGAGSHAISRPRDLARAPARTEYLWTSLQPEFGHESRQSVVAAYLAGLPRGSRVLDLGCGNGLMLASFRGRGWELVGVDISESGIAQARRACA